MWPDTGCVCLLPAAVTYCLQGSDYGVRVSSHMERFSEQYNLTVSSANKWEDRWAGVGGGGWGEVGCGLVKHTCRTRMHASQLVRHKDRNMSTHPNRTVVGAVNGAELLHDTTTNTGVLPYT